MQPHRKKGSVKIFQRSEFNACGEMSTFSTTYTGIQMRRFGELPRMEYDLKAELLGNAAAGASDNNKVAKDIASKGHPISPCEVKPLNLWQRLCEHFGVTHILDFTPGSGALALSGNCDYEGIAMAVKHCEWLDSILDRCVVYMAGKDKEFVKKLGGDDAFVDKVGMYLSGTMMEARRMMEPVDGGEVSDSDDCEENEDEI